MKLICVLLFISAATWADVDYSRHQIADFLRMAGNDVGPQLQRECAENVGDISIYGCGNMTSRVLGDYVASVVQLNRLRNQVREYSQRPAIRRNPKLRQQVSKVSQRLQCMRNTFDTFWIVCGSGHSKGSRCEGKSSIAFTYRDASKEMTLCPRYFIRGRLARAGTILHELSHKCGTQDWQYFTNLKGDYLKTPVDRVVLKNPENISIPVSNLTHDNADNFAYWGSKGFCLPDYDCESTLSGKILESIKAFLGR